jgi:hypothetical protein
MRRARNDDFGHGAAREIPETGERCLIDCVQAQCRRSTARFAERSNRAIRNHSDWQKSTAQIGEVQVRLRRCTSLCARLSGESPGRERVEYGWKCVRSARHPAPLIETKPR